METVGIVFELAAIFGVLFMIWFEIKRIADQNTIERGHTDGLRDKPADELEPNGERTDCLVGGPGHTDGQAPNKAQRETITPNEAMCSLGGKCINPELECVSCSKCSAA